MTARRRLRVVYWGTQASPYVVERLNAVAGTGAVDLEVWFDTAREDRSWVVDPSSWAFPHRYIDDRGHHRIPVEELSTTRPDVLVSCYDRPHFFAGLVAARSAAGRVAVRCLPPSAVWSGASTLRQTAARHAVFLMVDGAKVPGPDGAAYAGRYGLPGQRCWPVTQSVDLARFQRAATLTGDEQARLRARFGVGAGVVFGYFGRLIPEKGLDDLLAAYEAVARQVPSVQLLLVGDGSGEAALRRRTTGVPGVIFGGFVQPPALAEAYGAADAMVFPTHGDAHGLVVQEALAAGLPVIATEAAGDIRSRVHEGVNGFVVPAGDVDALRRRMAELAGDRSGRERMARAAAASASRFDHEAYADDFVRFVTELAATEARATPVATAARGAGWGLVTGYRAVARARRLLRRDRASDPGGQAGWRPVLLEGEE